MRVRVGIGVRARVGVGVIMLEYNSGVRVQCVRDLGAADGEGLVE